MNSLVFRVRFRRAPLFVNLCTALVILSAPLPALAVEVMNCGDEGPGSLREAINGAAPGDTVDLTQLPVKCDGDSMADSVITLSHGEIVIAQHDLMLNGPLSGSVTIQPLEGSGARVLHHTATGLLTINHLRISNGELEAGPNEEGYGGCIRSDGSIFLAHSAVTNCTTTAGFAVGGGINAGDSVALLDSVVSGNRAVGLGNTSLGGGILVHRALSILNSSVSGNEASNGEGVVASSQLPGVYSTVAYSTIDENTSAHCGAGYLQTTSGVTVLNSTISGNSASVVNGGLCVTGAAYVANSTIAFNTGAAGSGGMMMYDGTLTLQSSILARNTAPTDGADLYAQATASISGSNNAIMSHNANVPDAIVSLAGDPRLGPLQPNGGTTRTHALLPDSPAIGLGNNVGLFLNDQRGLGYPRESGPQFSVDIGAFQFDSIFYSDLDH